MCALLALTVLTNLPPFNLTLLLAPHFNIYPNSNTFILLVKQLFIANGLNQHEL